MNCLLSAAAVEVLRAKFAPACAGVQAMPIPACCSLQGCAPGRLLLQPNQAHPAATAAQGNINAINVINQAINKSIN